MLPSSRPILRRRLYAPKLVYRTTTDVSIFLRTDVYVRVRASCKLAYCQNTHAFLHRLSGNQPSIMTFYCGEYGNALTNNDASTLNDSSPFLGKTRRWYCIGECTGRFLGVYVVNSTLGTLDGCLLKIFIKVPGEKIVEIGYLKNIASWTSGACASFSPARNLLLASFHLARQRRER